MKPVTHDDIVGWVEKINKKFGRSNNGWTVRWIELLISRGAKAELHDDWYVVYIICPDAWGDTQLAIMSCDSDNVGAFRAMQHRIEQIAKDAGVKYILQGSELDDKYNDYLVRSGYRAQTFRKEV